jgi:hypothetical protein
MLFIPVKWEKHLSVPNGAQIIIYAKPLGERVLVSADIQVSEPCFSALFWFEGEIDGEPVTSATIATNSSRAPNVLRTQMGHFSRSLEPDSIHATYVPLDGSEKWLQYHDDQPHETTEAQRYTSYGSNRQQSTPLAPGGRAVLAIDEDDKGRIVLKLCLEHQAYDIEPTQIGNYDNANELEAWCVAMLNELGNAVVNYEDFNTKLKSIGLGWLTGS